MIYGGGGSNHTLARVLEESILIELYCHCHVAVENAFHLEHRTIKHSPANMTTTLQKLCSHIRRSQAHIFTPGRTAEYSVPDNIEKGLDELQRQANKVVAINDRLADNENDQPVVESEDLGVE